MIIDGFVLTVGRVVIQPNIYYAFVECLVLFVRVQLCPSITFVMYRSGVQIQFKTFHCCIREHFYEWDIFFFICHKIRCRFWLLFIRLMWNNYTIICWFIVYSNNSKQQNEHNVFEVARSQCNVELLSKFISFINVTVIQTKYLHLYVSGNFLTVILHFNFHIIFHYLLWKLLFMLPKMAKVSCCFITNNLNGKFLRNSVDGNNQQCPIP